MCIVTFTFLLYEDFLPWLQWSLGPFLLGVDHLVASQNTPVDWAELPVLSSYPLTPSYAAECWPAMAHRNSTWPSPAAAAEGTMRQS